MKISLKKRIRFYTAFCLTVFTIIFTFYFPYSIFLSPIPSIIIYLLVVKNWSFTRPIEKIIIIAILIIFTIPIATYSYYIPKCGPTIVIGKGLTNTHSSKSLTSVCNTLNLLDQSQHQESNNFYEKTAIKPAILVIFFYLFLIYSVAQSETQ